MDDTRPPGPEVTDQRGAHRETGLRGQIRREFGVMFSRRHQPIPLKVAKWAAFLAVTRRLYGTRWFRAWAFGLPTVGLGTHFFYRHMTRCWTEPWGGWNDGCVSLKTPSPPGYGSAPC